MARQIIGRGAAANDGTGDTAREAARKINDNFSELYDRRLVRAGWAFATLAARDAASVTADDIGFVCFVEAASAYYELRAVTPAVQWQLVGGGAAPTPSLWTPASLSPGPSIWIDGECERTLRTGVERVVSRTSTPHVFRRISGDAPGLLLSAQREGIEFSPSHGLGGSRLSCDEGDCRNLTRAASYGALFAVYQKTSSDMVQRCLFSATTATGGSSRFVCLIGGDSPSSNRPGLIVRRLDADSSGVLFDSSDRGTGWQMVLWEMTWSSGRGRIWRNGAVSVENASQTTAGSTSDTQSAAAVGLGAFVTDISALHHADALVASVVGRFGSTALSTDDIDRLFGWAAHAYGLADLLPSGHPYKTSAPTV